MRHGELSEAAIQRQVRDYLAACGIDSIHFANGADGMLTRKTRSLAPPARSLRRAAKPRPFHALNPRAHGTDQRARATVDAEAANRPWAAGDMTLKAHRFAEANALSPVVYGGI